MTPGLTAGQLAVTRAVLRRFFKPEDTEVFLFGSRATGTFRPDSDLDILLKQKSEIPFGTLGSVREAFEESSLPFKADIADFHCISESFRRNISRSASPLSLE